MGKSPEKLIPFFKLKKFDVSTHQWSHSYVYTYTHTYHILLVVLKGDKGLSLLPAILPTFFYKMKIYTKGLICIYFLNS